MYHKCAKDENGSSPGGVEQAKKKPSGRVKNIGDLPETFKNWKNRKKTMNNWEFWDKNQNII